MPYQTLDPATGEIVADFSTLTDAEVGEAVTRAVGAYGQWRETPVAKRARLLGTLADLYDRDREQLARIVTNEMGKPFDQALGEISIVADIYRYYASNASDLLAPEAFASSLGGRAEVSLQPSGTVLGIMPWNYPFYQVARLVGPNILLGNTILLKHAGNVPLAALTQERLMQEAGFPKDAYINLFATNDQIAHIVIPASGVCGVSLTGSERAGAAVAKVAGEHLKKVVLELGGSDAFIVLDDHNMDWVVEQAVNGRVRNAGQACTAAKRMIVLDAVYDKFVAKFGAAMQAVVPTDPTERNVLLGPLSSHRALDEVLEQVQDALDKGATLLAGGQRVPGPGAFMQATVLADVTEDMRAYHEEIFGPVAVVHRASDAAEAVRLANDSPYGLGGQVFSSDLEAARAVAGALDTGMVFINSLSDSAPDLPFGGTKLSGFGRELGKWGLEEFANKKLIHLLESAS